MPLSADDNKKDDGELASRFAEEEHEFEVFKQGLRKLVAFYRDKLAKADAALAALEGKTQPSSEPRVNKAIKNLLATKKVPLTRDEIRAELLAAGVVSDTITDRARVDRSLRQCVNAATLVEQDGKFELPGGK